MVPVGEKPPERVAVSLTGPPTMTGPDAWVTTLVLALVTTTDSFVAPQPLATALLALSPL